MTTSNKPPAEDPELDTRENAEGSESHDESDLENDDTPAADEPGALRLESTPPKTPEVAPFLDGLPDDPELNTLVLAFTRGDYRTVRELAPRLASRAENEEVAEAATDLLRRIKPDPLLRYLFLISVALLVVLSIFAYGQGH